MFINFKKLIPNKIKKSIKLMSLAGNNVECIICEKTFVTFLPFGVSPAPMRPNAKCPNCKSLERTRILWYYLTINNHLFHSSKNVLHVAPEESIFKKFSTNPKINYYPVDKFTTGYKYSKGTRKMDITAIDYEDEKFDFILCSHVLEHIINDAAAISELYRVMKTGGFGIFQVPIDMNREKTFEDKTITSPSDRQKFFGQSDHVRIYGRDYLDRLSTSGFQVELDDASIKTSDDLKFRFGFGSGQHLIIGRKNPVPIY